MFHRHDLGGGRDVHLQHQKPSARVLRQRAAYTTRWHRMQSEQHQSNRGGEVVVELLCHHQEPGLGREETLQSSCTSSFYGSGALILIDPAVGTTELAKLLSSIARGGCDSSRWNYVHLLMQQVSVLIVVAVR